MHGSECVGELRTNVNCLSAEAVSGSESGRGRREERRSRRPASAADRQRSIALRGRRPGYCREWRRNYGDRGRGVTLYPQVQDLYLPSQRCGLCQNFKQTTLTTRLYKVRTTGVNPAGDAGDTSPQYFGWGDVNGNIPANIITYFWI